MSIVLMLFAAVVVWDANGNTHRFELLGSWSLAHVIFVTLPFAASRPAPRRMERPA